MSGVTAIIPARSGSKSIIDKNIIKLSGHPVIAYSIASAKLSKKIDRIVVSTDSQEYAEIAIRYGAEVPFIRPDEISTDDSEDKDFILHALEWFKKEENKIPEFIIHLRPTTPLRDPLIIDDACNTIIYNEKCTSLRSAHPAPESPFKWFKRNDEGYFINMIDHSSKIDFLNAPKESFDTVFIPNGYVDILKTKYILDNYNIHGDNVFGYISPSCTEIDSLEELEYVAFQLKKNQSCLLNYLNKKNN